MSVWVLGLSGKGTNQAVAAQRMGVRAHLISRHDVPIDADMTGGLVFLAQTEAPADAIAAFFATPAAQGGRKILNIAPMVRDARALLDLSDMAIVGQAEFAAFLQLDREPNSIDDLLPIQPMLTRHNQAAVVILDGVGTVAVWADRTMLVGSLSPEQMSAGLAADCICGTVAAAVAQGIGPERAMTLACAAASLAATGTIPTRAEIEAEIAATGR